MDTLGIEATPEEVDLMIDEIDQDNNGEIDFEGRRRLSKSEMFDGFLVRKNSGDARGLDAVPFGSTAGHVARGCWISPDLLYKEVKRARHLVMGRYTWLTTNLFVASSQSIIPVNEWLEVDLHPQWSQPTLWVLNV